VTVLQDGPERAEYSTHSEGSVYSLLMEEGFSTEFGARPMERAIEQLIAQPLAKAILEDRIKPDQQLIAKAANGSVIFSPVL